MAYFTSVYGFIMGFLLYKLIPKTCNLEISVYIMKTAKTNEKYYNSEIPSNTTIIPNCNSLLLYQNNSSWVSAFIQQPQI